jgi:GWxTD domain-containing protein
MVFTLIAMMTINTLAEKPTKKKLNRTNLVYLYTENKFTDFGAQIYHSSDEKSTVYLNVRLKDLQYKTLMNNNSHLSEFRISYQLYGSYESKEIIDTATLYFKDSLNYGTEADMIVDFDIKAKYPGEYILKITLSDLNRKDNNSVFQIYTVSKSNKNTAQNFHVMDNENYSVFGKHIENGQFFRILCNHQDTGQLHIRYYNRQLPIAKTPFAAEKNIGFKFEPDSLYSVSLSAGKTELLKLPYHGIYHVQTDLSQTEGLTLFYLDDGFPDIESPLQAILPLRYLTTQKEFDALLNYQDHKVAVDSFWLERASNQPERAKNMIARYYQRVVFANQMFTSYQEGWKTDRGIIYIIYGPPTEVYKKTGHEEWIYGEREHPLSIKFYFDQVENPFTFNDFSLQRSSVYKSSWYMAIENWRR